jgi:hypothetical protein
VSVDGVSNAGGNVDFVAGSNMTITPNDGANTVTFSSTAGGIGGSGATNYVPKFTASTTLGNSAIYQSGSDIGIGTTSPTGDLEIHDESGEASIIVGSGLPTNGQAFISFTQTDEGDIWSLGADDESDRFTISESASLGIDPRLTIYPGGNVGIGTTSPSQKLGVGGNIALEGSGASQSSAVDFRDNGGSEWQVQYLAGGLNFWESGIGSRMLIEDGGQVGIGLTNPGYMLHVNGNFFANTVNTGQGNNELYAMNQNVRTSDNPAFNRVYISDYGYALGGFHVGGSSDPGTDRLIVDGNAGIGVTPADKLDVNGDIRVRGADIKDTGGTPRVTLVDNGVLQLMEDGGAASLTVATDGDVGIGTISPASGYKLDVNGNLRANFLSTGYGDNNLYPMNQAVRTTDNVTFNRVALSDYGTALGGFHVGGTSDPGTDNLYVDGKVGIGTTSPHADAKLHVAWNDYYAGYFTSSMASNSTHVIHSEYTGGGTTDARAVYGYSRPADYYGIGGDFEGGFYGVVGEVNATGSHWYYGVRGKAEGGTGGFKYGVYGSASGTGTNYGVYYSGGLGGSGSKSCIVKTSQGPTALYCQESPENWFEDFGEGTLVNGQTHVELDALFLETVTINAANPMKVFVQLEGDCNGVYVSKGITGFDVVELKSGASNVPFSYRIVAKRKGFEDRRLDYTAAGENDAYLYPEAAERMEKERLEKAGE